jgi:choline-glycine betaine transporter
MRLALTFGMAGRIVATALVLLPEWLMFQLPWYYTIIGRVAYVGLIVMFLRAIWAPVRLGRRNDQPPLEVVPTDWLQNPEKPVIAHRRDVTTRW